MASISRGRAGANGEVGARGSAGDRAGFVDVAAHLGEEGVDAVELERGAEPAEQIDIEEAAVEVGGEVDQVDFDGPGMGAEGGVGADVGGAGDGGPLAVDEGADG